MTNQDEEITTEELLKQYLAGPTKLKEVVAGMDTEQLKARPIPEKMSTLEVVGHLVESDKRMAKRIRRAIAGRDAEIVAPGPHVVTPPDHDLRDIKDDLQELRMGRWALAQELRGLGPATWERVAMRREAKDVTIRDVLALTVRHLDGHVDAIQEKRAALGL